MWERELKFGWGAKSDQGNKGWMVRLVLTSVTDRFYSDNCFNGHWIVGDLNDLFRPEHEHYLGERSGEHLHVSMYKSSREDLWEKRR